MENFPHKSRDVVVPRKLWLAGELSLLEKLLYVEILSLCEDYDQGCSPSNQYFANLLNISVRQVQKHLANLEKHGFITMTITKGNEREIMPA